MRLNDFGNDDICEFDEYSEFFNKAKEQKEILNGLIPNCEHRQ